MSLPVQGALFGPNKIIADTRRKLAELYFRNPQIAESEKRVILEFWKDYEGLVQVLGYKLTPFTSWFLTATSPETITQSLRALKEDGTISLSPENIKNRQEREQKWRSYWGNERRIRER